MTLTPAYGRDYRNKAEVLEAWLAGKDFLIADVHHQYSGKPVNREQFKGEGTIKIRYKGLTQVVVIKI